MTGTAIAQLLTIAFSPIVQRMFTQEEWGFFALVSSIYGIVALIAGGRYEVALLVPKRTVDAINLLGLSFLVNLGFFLLFYLVLFFLSFAGWGERLGIWYYLLPVFVLIVGLSQSLIAWNNRRKRYREIATFRISQSLLNNVFSISTSLAKFRLNGVLIAYFGSGLISLVVAFYQIKADFRLIIKGISFKRMLFVGRKYARFPLINTFQSLLDALQLNGLIYLISFLFGDYYVGIFSLAIRILFLPMGFIGSAIAQVSYQEVNSLIHQNKPLFPLVKRTIRMSALIISPVLIILVIGGPFLFSFVYGKAWEESGVYARYLAAWVCIDFIRASLSQIPLIFNKHHILLIFSITSNSLILIVFLVGFMMKLNLGMILMMTSALQVLLIFALINWIVRVSKSYNAKLSNRDHQ
ncbi:oligosaccharide flippase family protein [Fluviicola sp.]|jgi:O-antigen/teichoic acid export membrane protein|uniref:oligosaccharide flippase family protein n=1 Tax=Fluviicola sp. TaxID=1917219 RepID=UPI002835290E|nr:oligosaccharide flippase family protein [Fluviicola sp.]MDR0802364.1 oligosaccharide flippase family protein [Fluviicola sp.]